MLSLPIFLSMKSLSQGIDCEKYLKEESDGTIYDSFENPPVPKQGYETFYKEIDQKLQIVPDTGRVFVQFVVDTLGDIYCLSVVKSNDKKLNERAIALVKGTKFIPAEQRGEKVVSTMVLPVTFGKPSKKKARRGQRNPLYNSSGCWAQSSLNCDSIYSQDFSQDMFIFYEKIAFPADGLEGFYKSLREKTKSSKERGKVFVGFVVDTTGKAICIKVVKTDNKLLNEQAEALIEETEFVPAEQRGKKILSSMVLPVTFGGDSSGKKGEKRSKRRRN